MSRGRPGVAMRGAGPAGSGGEEAQIPVWLQYVKTGGSANTSAIEARAPVSVRHAM